MHTEVSLVHTSLNAGVMHLEIRRPEAGNAVNLALAEQLLAALRAYRETAAMRVLLITAAGRNFMAGGDLPALHADPQAAVQLVSSFNDAVACLAAWPVPVVCAAQGLVAGGGLGLALTADLLIAEKGARFTVGSPAVGLPPDAGTTWSLVRCVGSRKAAEMTLMCSMLDAPAALACGLINEIAPPGKLLEIAQAKALHLARSAQCALGHSRRLLKQAPWNDLTTHLHQETQAFAQCMQSPDFNEGVSAMLAKRKPQFA